MLVFFFFLQRETVLLVRLGLLTELPSTRVEWKCALEESGVLFVTSSGHSMMQ